MPHNTAVLNAGESLTVGQRLVSNDGRFELLVEKSGLRLLAYLSTGKANGKVETLFKSKHRFIGNADRLELPVKMSPGSFGSGRSTLRLFSETGAGLWEPPLNAWGKKFHRLALKDDGQLVLHGFANKESTVRYVAWSAIEGRLPDQKFRHKKSDKGNVAVGAPKPIRPNDHTVDVLVGTLNINPGLGEGDLVNVSDAPLGFRDAFEHYTVPPGGIMSVIDAPGSLAIYSADYQVSGDAVIARPVANARPARGPNGERFICECSGVTFGLRSPGGPNDGPGEVIDVRDLLPSARRANEEDPE